MGKAINPFSMVKAAEKPETDSARFERLTRHLRTGSGQRLESVLLKLEAEKAARS